MKKSAPKIQASAQENSLRDYGNQLSQEASGIKAQLAPRATKIATTDNTPILSRAAAGGNAKTLAERLSKATTGTERISAILGSNSAATTNQTNTLATGVAQRVGTMANHAKRGLGVTGSVFQSLSQTANAAQNAAEITANSKMQAQAAKMQAVGNAFSSVVDYKIAKDQEKDNKKILDALTYGIDPNANSSPVTNKWKFPGS